MTEGLAVVLVLAVLVIIVIWRTAVIVPQQSAYVVERLGKYNATLNAGFHVLFPFSSMLATAMNIISRRPGDGTSGAPAATTGR